MELFVLDNNFNNALVIDEYDSFIWTEKYDESGDFQLVCSPFGITSERLQVDILIRIPGSLLIMVVLERTITEDSEGIKSLTITGRTIDYALFSNRVVGPMNGIDWEIDAPPGTIIKDVVDAVCITGSRISSMDVINELMTTDRTTTHSSSIVETVAKGTLYDFIEGLAKEYDLGFKIEIRSEFPQLRFVVYDGTYKQSIIFRSSLDHITEEEVVESRKGYKNTAYIWGRDSRHIEVITVGNEHFRSYDRRVLYVDGRDVDFSVHTEEKGRRLLRQLGWRALAKSKYTNQVDGRAAVDAPYIYGVGGSYSLGDIIRWEDSYGGIHRMRVTEYTWMNDNEGPREYPTFRSLEN